VGRAPRFARAGTGRRRRVAGSALSHPNTGQQKTVRHPPTGPAQTIRCRWLPPRRAPIRTPAARRRTAGGGRRDWPPASGAGCALLPRRPEHPEESPRATAPRAFRLRVGMPVRWPRARSPWAPASGGAMRVMQQNARTRN
jgi:hypothetical protein